MTTETGTIETSTLSEYRYKTNSNRLGLWLFIISDAFVFLGLLVSRFYLLGFDYHPETNQVLGVIITLMLLLSSYTMYRGEVSMSFGDTPGFIRNAMFTMILGTLFLIGVVGVEWGTAPAGTADGADWFPCLSCAYWCLYYFHRMAKSAHGKIQLRTLLGCRSSYHVLALR